MNNQLMVTNEQVDALSRVAKALAVSGYFQDATEVAKAYVKVQAGQELGLPPVASMSGIHIVKGKPTLGANLIATLIKNDPRYNYRVLELTDDVCRIQFYEDGQECGISEFTAADAQKAGTQNMNKFPKNMLFARAISNGAKWFTPGIFGGVTVYTPEELGADVDEDGDIIDVMPEPKIIETHPDSMVAELEAVTGDVAPLPDDEQVIYETSQADYFKAVIALIPRYDNVFAVKNALKKIGYSAVPKTAMERVSMYSALRDHADERDAEESGAFEVEQVDWLDEPQPVNAGAYAE